MAGGHVDRGPEAVVAEGRWQSALEAGGGLRVIRVVRCGSRSPSPRRPGAPDRRPGRAGAEDGGAGDGRPAARAASRSGSWSHRRSFLRVRTRGTVADIDGRTPGSAPKSVGRRHMSVKPWKRGVDNRAYLRRPAVPPGANVLRATVGGEPVWRPGRRALRPTGPGHFRCPTELRRINRERNAGNSQELLEYGTSRICRTFFLAVYHLPLMTIAGA